MLFVRRTSSNQTHQESVQKELVCIFISFLIRQNCVKCRKARNGFLKSYAIHSGWLALRRWRWWIPFSPKEKKKPVKIFEKKKWCYYTKIRMHIIIPRKDLTVILKQRTLSVLKGIFVLRYTCYLSSFPTKKKKKEKETQLNVTHLFPSLLPLCYSKLDT